MAEGHLRFSPSVLARLGEELVPYADLGILELVKNAYDADATKCRIELLDANQPGGTVVVSDNGHGMTGADIADGWLVIGSSKKSHLKPTGLGRLPVGDKGLGRLAALRMGSGAHLTTRPRTEPGTSYGVQIEWSEFDAAETVEDVLLNVTSARTKLRPGSEIRILGLRDRLGRREVRRLARSVLLLTDPFAMDVGFRAELVAPEFEDLERLVRDAYFDAAEFHLVAEIGSDGQAAARVLDWRGEELWTAEHSTLSSSLYETSPAVFDLWVFLLDESRFRELSATKREVQDWLAVFGGVHLYHRDVRVSPYGDPGHDWLDMNLSRARSPELRPSTNTSVGRVVVSGSEELLIQKTDRSGFIENQAFQELRRFAMDALAWMARERLRDRERKRQEGRVAASKGVQRASNSLAQAVIELPASQRVSVERAVQRFERAHQRQTRELQNEVELYRTLATVGTTVAMFAHESRKPVELVLQMTRSIERRGRRALGDQYDATLAEPVAVINQSADALQSYAAVPLELLQRNKRRTGRVEINSVVEDMARLFRPFFKTAGVQVDLDLVDPSPALRGSIASVESIVANLITNALNAVSSRTQQKRARRVAIRTDFSGGRIVLQVLDSGPGINDIALGDIWLPGETTTPDGTGLGLTIVRDSVSDLGGTAVAVEHGEFGGAEFLIELPALAR